MSIVTLSYPKTHCLGQNEIPSNEFEKRVEKDKIKPCVERIFGSKSIVGVTFV